MAFALGWLVFSLAVGLIAKARGRNPFGWAILAGLISPVIAFIVLFVMDDVSEVDVGREDILNVDDFVNRMERFSNLHDDGMIDDKEYISKKSKLISEAGDKEIPIREEDFLEKIKYLKDEGITNGDEIEELKSFVI